MRKTVRICVDPLRKNNQPGRFKQSCHLFIVNGELELLHDFAAEIGMKPEWLHNKPGRPHYDLTPYMRARAVINGAVEVDRRRIIAIEGDNENGKTVGKGGDE